MLILHRCHTHIINLATQAVISAYRKSKFYGKDPEEDITPDDAGMIEREDIGIICTICIKVCLFILSICLHFRNEYIQAHSSAQRKQDFKTIQYRHKINPIQLILDMKVRWSLTYVMLTHAESRQCVSFIPLYDSLSSYCLCRLLTSSS